MFSFESQRDLDSELISFPPPGLGLLSNDFQSRLYRNNGTAPKKTSKGAAMLTNRTASPVKGTVPGVPGPVPVFVGAGIVAFPAG